MRALLSLAFPLLTLTLLSTGCPIGDPGRSISGNVGLGSTIDASGFVQLEVRAFSDDESWTPADGLPEVFPEYSASVPLDSGTFPYSYELWSLGTVPQKSWRVVAWLSASQERLL